MVKLDGHLLQFSNSLEMLRDFIDSIENLLEAERNRFLQVNRENLAPIALAFDVIKHKFGEDFGVENSLVPDFQDLLPEGVSADVEQTTSPEGTDSFEITFEGLGADQSKSVLTTMKDILAHERKMSLLYQSSLITLTSIMELLVSQIISTNLRRHPQVVSSSKKTFTLEDLESFKSIDDARHFIIEKEIDSIIRGSFESWIDYLKLQVKLSMGYLDSVFDEISEVFQRRNICVHNGGIVNAIYLSNVKSVSTEVQLGEPIEVTKEYLNKAINVIEVAGVLIGAELWKKLEPHDETRASSLSRIAYNHLLHENWTVAKDIYFFLMNDRKLSESTQLLGTINYWQCCKWLGEFESIETEIMKADYSAKDRLYRLSLLALRDDVDGFFKLLPSCVPSDLSISSFNEWPIFREMRRHTKYQEFLKSMSRDVKGSKAKGGRKRKVQPSTMKG